ncbi:hypothetical protein [uncultured Clostridium sp.]|uniref:hypothetical protein n=1 Tax=uncultured Clostridium sp. TaxID=59620 RepID=UPI0028E5CEC6|nr:hypothetical protein [uncultured Clostridium sp.]
MNVKCENINCKHEFEPQMKEQYLGAMISETYFECPKCGAKYIICLDNPKTRKLKNNIEKIRVALNSNLPRKFKNVLNVALKDNINVHKQAMSKLMKGEYEWRCQVK